MRSALVRVAGALNECQPALIENLLETGEPRVQPERDVGRIGADLQHLPGGNGQRRATAAVERIVVGRQHAERVVAAAEIEHDEVAHVRALRTRQVREKLGRCERHGECGDAALDELASGDVHTSWYSGDPAIRCTTPGAFACSCASLPVHAPVARRYPDSSAVTLESSGAAGSASRKYASSASGVFDALPAFTAAARLNFWLPARAEAKFMRASIALVENHVCPASQPLTSGGSNSTCPMLDSGVSASLTENPLQPTSFSARAMNSAGHE